MLTIEQFKEMLNLQEQLEICISGPDWRDKEHDFALCIHMECAEIIDHYGWKHWKDLNKQPDFDAIAMELVDVWHFAMAHLLLNKEFDIDFTYSQILDAIKEYDNNNNMVQLCIGMGYLMFAKSKFPFGNFIGAMDKIGMSFDYLYILYISKNVLNLFRQDHGYKEGKYAKYWNEKEDNEHLQEIRNELGNDLNADTLYKQLESRYNNRECRRPN